MIVFTATYGWDLRRISMSSPVAILNKKSKARTPEHVSEIMRRVPRRDTQNELSKCPHHLIHSSKSSIRER
jgi:hypothetical protein